MVRQLYPVEPETVEEKDELGSMRYEVGRFATDGRLRRETGGLGSIRAIACRFLRPRRNS